jgi:hypothetical protein
VEDVPDVRLDRRLREDEPLDDLGVRASGTIDRECRTIAAANQAGQAAHVLRLTGAPIVPAGEGLEVKQALDGSLIVDLLLGGLYNAITGQPVSFALNLASLLGYTRAVVRRLRGNDPPREIPVQVPPAPLPPGRPSFVDGYEGEPAVVASLPQGSVMVHSIRAPSGCGSTTATVPASKSRCKRRPQTLSSSQLNPISRARPRAR